EAPEQSWQRPRFVAREDHDGKARCRPQHGRGYPSRYIVVQPPGSVPVGCGVHPGEIDCASAAGGAMMESTTGSMATTRPTRSTIWRRVISAGLYEVGASASSSKFFSAN